MQAPVILLAEEREAQANEVLALLASRGFTSVVRARETGDAFSGKGGAYYGLLIVPGAAGGDGRVPGATDLRGKARRAPVILIADEHANIPVGLSDDPSIVVLRRPLVAAGFMAVVSSMLAMHLAADGGGLERGMMTALAESSPFPVVMLDGSGAVIYANMLAAGLLDLPPDAEGMRLHESSQWTITDFDGNPVPPDGLPYVIAVRSGVPVFDTRLAVTIAGGRRLFLSLNCTPVRSREGAIVHLMMSLNDITEWVRIESVIMQQNQQLARQNMELQKAMEELDRRAEQVRLSEEKFFKAFQLNPLSTAITRLSDGLIVEANEAFFRELGYPRDRVIGRTTLEIGFYANEAERISIMEKVRAHGSVADVEINVTDSAGKPHTGLFSASLVDIGGEAHVISMFKDITLQKAAEERLDREMSVLEALTLLSGTLIAHSYSIADVAAMVLRNAQWLTKSEHGFVSEVDPVTRNNIGHTLTQMMEIGCDVTAAAKAVEFSPDERGSYPGLWGHVLNERKAFFTNEPGSHPARGGIPEGHVPITRFLGVPVMLGDELLGEIALANSAREYGPADIEAIKRLAQLYAFAIDRLRDDERVAGSLREKEVLLKEVHHRVKNNLQIIYSLFSLQSRVTANPEVAEILRSSQNRIRTMSLIHEKLYKSGDFARIDLSDYVRTFAGELYNAYAGSGMRISLRVDADPISVELSTAIPCGLIVNELVSNALKHAFPPGKHTLGEILISLRKLPGETVELSVCDNGVGMPAGVNFKMADTLGLKLVGILGEEQLKGELELKCGEGTTVVLRFKSR